MEKSNNLPSFSIAIEMESIPTIIQYNQMLIEWFTLAGEGTTAGEIADNLSYLNYQLQADYEEEDNAPTIQ